MPTLIHERPRRVLVIGATGAGKSTVAARISSTWSIPRVELDTLHWGRNWTKRPEFEADVAAWIARDAWVIDGSYLAAVEPTWPRSDLVVWLDLPFATVFARQFRRSLRRIWTKEEIFAGNRESFRGYFLSKDSLMIWLFKTFRSRRRRFAEFAQQHPDVCLVRLTTPRAERAWLASLASR